MSPIRRIVTHRRSAFAIVLTGCALALIVWRPWQPRANVTAATTEAPSGDEQQPAPANSINPTESLLISAASSVDPAVDTALIPPKPTFIGAWRDDFYGKRIFHFSDDGTATMTIELDSVGQLIYGPKLTFFIDWTLENDILKLKMTGGEPKSALAAAKLFGESSEQRIESLDANEMKLRSLDSNKLYTHRRVSVEE